MSPSKVLNFRSDENVRRICHSLAYRESISIYTRCLRPLGRSATRIPGPKCAACCYRTRMRPLAGWSRLAMLAASEIEKVGDTGKTLTERLGERATDVHLGKFWGAWSPGRAIAIGAKRVILTGPAGLKSRVPKCAPLTSTAHANRNTHRRHPYTNTYTYRTYRARPSVITRRSDVR